VSGPWCRPPKQQSVLPFDLAVGPLLRVTLLKLAEQEHVLLLTLHHIVSDGWSMNVLIDEFIRCYDAFDAGQQPQLAALPIQYSDYALWQRRWLEAGEQARQLDYWQAQLGDEHPVLELPLDHSRPAMPSYRGTRYEFAVDEQLAEQLRNTAQQHQVTSVHAACSVPSTRCCIATPARPTSVSACRLPTATVAKSKG
jgi:hypothetical protein